MWVWGEGCGKIHPRSTQDPPKIHPRCTKQIHPRSAEYPRSAYIEGVGANNDCLFNATARTRMFLSLARFLKRLRKQSALECAAGCTHQLSLLAAQEMCRMLEMRRRLHSSVSSCERRRLALLLVFLSFATAITPCTTNNMETYLHQTKTNKMHGPPISKQEPPKIHPRTAQDPPKIHKDPPKIRQT